METGVRIEFAITQTENRGHGGRTRGRDTFGGALFDPNRPDEQNSIQIEINPEQLRRLRVRGPQSAELVDSGKGYLTIPDTWIDIPLEAAIVHEFGHAHWMYGLRKRAPYIDDDGSNPYAVDWENKYRQLVGLPLRLWHD